MLLTTSVGSLPKPDYLFEARKQARRGEITSEQLHEFEVKATKFWVEWQDTAGIDIIVDGEMYRGDMAAFFGEVMEGFATSQLVRSYGNRYYRKPIVIGPVQRPQQMTVEWWKYAQSLTKKPVKGMLTGPYTIMDWSFNEHYPTRRDTALAIADALHEEAKELEAAGCQYLQIDEPAVSTRTDELDLAIEALGRVTKGLQCKTLTHICYGDFPAIYPKMLQLPVDHIDLEMKNSDYELVELFRQHPFTKEIGCGVVDVHSHRIETIDETVKGLQRVLEVIPPERVYVDPDCGLKTRSVEEAQEKLTTCVTVARLAKEALTSAAA
jgi:5-methyltetrahydropteroyltriglutamate--homocysteine methyltransferase